MDPKQLRLLGLALGWGTEFVITCALFLGFAWWVQGGAALFIGAGFMGLALGAWRLVSRYRKEFPKP